jgi:hypothetical protein
VTNRKLSDREVLKLQKDIPLKSIDIVLDKVEVVREIDKDIRVQTIGEMIEMTDMAILIEEVMDDMIITAEDLLIIETMIEIEIEIEIKKERTETEDDRIFERRPIERLQYILINIPISHM